MSTISPNLGMTLNEGPDQVDVTDLANNFDTLDDAFATHTPTTIAVGDAAAQGASLVVARGDHRHGAPAFGAPVALGTAIATGTSGNINHSDHVHTIGTGTVNTASIASGLSLPLTNLAIAGQTDVGEAIVGTDALIMYDVSQAANRILAVSRIRDYLQVSDFVHTTTAIGAALADADEILVYDASATAQRMSAMTRVSTYVQASISGDVTFSGGVSAIGSGVIVDADISATAEIAVSKLADGAAYALLRTASDGTSVEWGTAGQIHFPATQAASADVNDLDDYEEGTWTALMASDGGAGVPTYTSQIGNYVKIGKQLFVAWVVTISSKNTLPVGSVYFIGPMATAGTQVAGNICEVGGITATATYTQIGVEERVSNSYFLLQNTIAAGAGPGFITVAMMANNTTVIGSCTTIV